MTDALAVTDPWAGFPEDWPACRCDCGLPVGRVKKTDREQGIRRGEPMRFVDKTHMPAATKPYRRLEVASDETRVCVHCEQVTPVNRMTKRKPTGVNPEGIGGVCRPCEQKRRRASRHSPTRAYDERVSVLPPYEELKRLYVEVGMSQYEIAVKFGTSQPNVWRTIKRRAERRGEWPLLTKQQVTAKGIRKAADAKKWIPRVAVTSPLREYLAENRMTYQDFSDASGIERKYLRDLLAKGSRFRGANTVFAARILHFIGEEVADWMLDKARDAGFVLEAPAVEELTTQERHDNLLEDVEFIERYQNEPGSDLERKANHEEIERRTGYEWKYIQTIRANRRRDAGRKLARAAACQSDSESVAS